MQYLSYEKCLDAHSVAAEIARLEKAKLLTPELAAAVDPGKIAAFFSTDLGRKLRSGTVLREFKFSILDDGANYSADLAGEQVLLQGVVDCALMEDDGITIVDFKTDYVTEDTLDAVAARYRPQVTAYADAMKRIYELPVKAVYLYLFHLDRFLEIMI